MIDWLCYFFTDDTLLFSIILTAKTCIVALITLGICGVLVAYILAKRKNMFTAILEFIITLPLVFPPVGTGFILLLLLGRNGWLGRLGFQTDIIFTRSSVYLAALIAGLPLVVKPVQSALERDVFKLAEAARTLGKNQYQTLILVILPSVRKSLAAGLVLASARSLGEVGITLIIGGNLVGRTNTVSLEIYNAVMDADFDRASFLCLILGGISVLLFMLLRKVSGDSL
ncbi:Sulfate transport system permease protein CysW [Vibrio aerogenes CECT 7868]|uniref:Sulfate transport system permease protein CysW n=1 Tax=Vibrio aerogenes CECT 7868 TaxID=1216006 RepID=A0A1M6A3C9_9VIBR|nr:ABC transporter permease subunit [Vibrio aerogenes]SHI30653.1 Sulfate transport system permease protein CysW [Vibrio aerogenes CECT 7868]